MLNQMNLTRNNMNNIPIEFIIIIMIIFMMVKVQMNHIWMIEGNLVR